MRWKKIDPENPPIDEVLCKNKYGDILYGVLNNGALTNKVGLTCTFNTISDFAEMCLCVYYFDPADLEEPSKDKKNYEHGTVKELLSEMLEENEILEDLRLSAIERENNLKSIITDLNKQIAELEDNNN